MAKQDIVSGLLFAMQKGESLEKAMMSFYSAGYSKEDIEEAAKEASIIRSSPNRTIVSQKPVEKTNNLPKVQEQKNQEKINIKPKIDTSTQKTAPPTIQKVSKYEEKSLKSKRLLISILIILIFFILTGIIALIFYGEKILNLFMG